ncbi:MAG: hypothetical protein HFE43_09855 [Oscillospiraceae bacterium]|jgi:hypothetical protein|nr:hypothetical protein [Oscillospiraceae bacterium]
MINQPGAGFPPGTAAPAGPPYMGGFPVRCPRCSHIVSTRYCSHCGMDLSTCYTVRQPAPPPSYGACGFPVQPPPSRLPAPMPVPPVPGAPFQPQPIPPGMPAFAGGAARKHTLRNTLLICGVSLACILLFSGLFFAVRRLVESGAPAGGYYREDNGGSPPPSVTEGYYYPQGISREEYEKIREGMSYALVCQIIGGEGELQETGKTLQGDLYYTYLWYGESSPSAMAFITFMDGAVTTIAGDGLD